MEGVGRRAQSWKGSQCDGVGDELIGAGVVWTVGFDLDGVGQVDEAVDGALDAEVEFPVLLGVALVGPEGGEGEGGAGGLAEEGVDGGGEGGALEDLVDLEEDLLLLEEPVLGALFGFVYELEGEVVEVVVVLEGVLVGDEVAALAPHHFHIVAEGPFVLLQPPQHLLFLHLHHPLEVLHQQLHLHLQLNAQAVQPALQLLPQQRPLLDVALDGLALTAPHRPLVNQLHRLRLVPDHRGHPLHAVAQRADGSLVRVLRPPARVVKAEPAENGVLLAGEVGADVGGLLLAVDEAGDCARRKRVVLQHHLISSYDNNIDYPTPPQPSPQYIPLVHENKHPEY